MSSDKGYVKLFRSIQDNFVWADKPFAFGQAWIDLIMMVNHKDREIVFNGRVMCVPRGSVVTSCRKLAERWGWSKDRVLYFLRSLESASMIERKSDSKKTAITVRNYCIYQDSKGGTSRHNADTGQTPKRRRPATNKELEGIKGIKGSASAGGQSAALRPEDEHGDPLPDDYWEDA